MTLKEFRDFNARSDLELRVMHLKRKNLESRMEQAETDEEFNRLAEEYKDLDGKIRECARSYLNTKLSLIQENGFDFCDKS